MANILSLSIRKEIAMHPNLGAGNFLFIASENIPDPDAPFWYLENSDRTLFNGEQHSALSVNDIKRVSLQLAGWYARQSLHPGERVGLYLSSGLDYYFHYFALTSLGLIPVWLNGNLPANVAGLFLKHVEARLVITDSDRVVAMAAELGTYGTYSIIAKNRIELRDQTQLPEVYPYPHQPEDIVLICHSSGTTGLPKPVLYRNKSMCYGVCQFLIDPPEFTATPTCDGQYRFLSILPNAHHSALTYFMRALLSQMDFMAVTRPELDRIGTAISEFKPSAVMSFPCHYVSLATLDSASMPYDFGSVSWWLSVGDAAHQPHIKKLLQHGYRVVDGGGFAPGSVFIDGLGSSEMGSIFFRLHHTPDAEHPLRCIGRPVKWIEATVLSEEGQELPANIIGKLGVRAPTLASYWEHAEMESASWVGGYFLTGDLVYKDEQGVYYHVDRTSDVIPTVNGAIYSALAEETVLKKFTEVDDCVVVGVPAENAQHQESTIFLAMKKNTASCKNELLEKINDVLNLHGQHSINYIQLTDLASLPTGPTGKIQKNKLRAQLTGQAVQSLAN